MYNYIYIGRTMIFIVIALQQVFLRVGHDINCFKLDDY